MQTFKIKAHRKIACDVYEITFEKPEDLMIQSGQFALVYLDHPDFYLGRPFSFSNISATDFTIIYKVVGQGTQYLSTLERGTDVKMRVPLGQGFPIDTSHQKILIYAGGLGLAPLLSLVQGLKDKTIHYVLGFQSEKDIYGLAKIPSQQLELFTDDGSKGKKGNVLNSEIDPFDYDAVYACGPEKMLTALMPQLKAHPHAYVSIEERMACGSGICMGCVCGKNNEKRVCVEGPVFKVKELV